MRGCPPRMSVHGFYSHCVRAPTNGERLCRCPAAIQPMCRTVSGCSTELTCRTLLIRSSRPVPAREPGNIETPVAMNTRLRPGAVEASVRGRRGPRHRHEREEPTRPGRSACSITTTSELIATGPRSPLSTAPCSTRHLGPMVTSPVTTGMGATQAVGSIWPICRGWFLAGTNGEALRSAPVRVRRNARSGLERSITCGGSVPAG